MLRSFRFSNHRSFRAEAEVLLLPAEGDRTALPVTAVYGANASGKSNLLDALHFMAATVRDSYARWEPDRGIPRRPFRSADGTAATSTYVIEVVLDSVRHVYGFCVDDDRVLEEWLYTYPKGRRRVMFERTQDRFSLGTATGAQRTRGAVLKELTRPNALFLSLAAQVGRSELTPIYHWFTDQLRFVGGIPESRHDFVHEVEGFVGDSPSRRTRLRNLLRAADLGLEDLNVQEQVFDVGYDEYDQPHPVVLVPPTLWFSHTGVGELDMSEESAGTLRWLWLLLGVLRCLDDGGTAVVDEVDASFHPELTARLLGLFRDGESNPQGAQLIFTTHDATLLGTAMGDEVLRRDEVWFVEKDGAGASRLFPLTDFHPRRSGENRERRYLGGSYGGLPVLSSDDFLAALTEPDEVDGRAS